MTEVLPFIFKRITKKAPNGIVLEDKQLTVQGDSLKEVKATFDKEWNEK